MAQCPLSTSFKIVSVKKFILEELITSNDAYQSIIVADKPRRVGREVFGFLSYVEAHKSKQDAVTHEVRLKQHGRAKQELFKRIKRSFLS